MVSSKKDGKRTKRTAKTKRKRRKSRSFRKIEDEFETIEEVQEELRRRGLESSSLVVAVDMTASNRTQGKRTFGGKSLHTPGFNPYVEAMTAVAATLADFDDDGDIPVYGFGDATTRGTRVFSFEPDDEPIAGLDNVVDAYAKLVSSPKLKLAGPTSFAPAIRRAIGHVVESGMEYHILVILADGAISRGVPMDESIEALVDASNYPLSIVCIGVGDGPWDAMIKFDDEVKARRFDNFQFVEMEGVMRSLPDTASPETAAAAFACAALMETPQQYEHAVTARLINRRLSRRERSRAEAHAKVAVLDPPNANTPPPPAYSSKRRASTSSASTSSEDSEYDYYSSSS